MIVLGIETSCDETSVAVVKDGREVISNVISSQIDVHKKFGGVVPEIASRKHVESINNIINESVKEAGIDFRKIDLVAVTAGPGLIGALLVGLSSARALAYALKKPIIGVNHIEGHICANYISNPELEPPFISLIVSGGHTYLLYVKDYLEYELFGRTRDDAAGEAFDKVARAMGIGYPGGPIIDKLAKDGDDESIDFPRVMLEKDSYDFSFSGLKTAVLNYLNSTKQKGEEVVVENVAASFQKAVVDVLLEKTFRLAKEKNMNKIVLAGGVSANSSLRERFIQRGKEVGIDIFYPDLTLCTDNAAMIASAGYFNYIKGNDKVKLFANPNLGL